ncbi:MAG: PKD domain-containing protein, partial [Candidatus Dojkabacteria bacterium]
PTYSQGIRVDVGDDGVVAALFNVNTSGSEYEGEIYVIEADGSARQTGSITLPETDTGNGGYNQRFEDIAVDAANSQIIVTGYTQRCSTYQSPFVLAYSYTVGDFGTRNWRSFSLWCSGADDESLTADSRGVRVEIGEDGSLLFVGKADGGNNLFTRQAQEHTQTQTNNVEIDRWNSGAGFGTGEVAYIAKLNKQTGQVVDGQFQYTSTGVNQAESFAARAVQSNILGQTYWGGSAEKDLPERASLQLDGVDIGPRIDNETALIAVSSDFSERELVASWTSAGSPGTGEIQDIAINGATVAVLARTSWEIVTSNAQDSTYSGADDLFLAVWGSADVDPTLAAPDASFNLNTTSGTGPLTVYPSNLSAFNSQNTYEWDMGDGTTYNSYTFAEHQFSEAGTYEVQYTITNSQGTDTSTVIVEVQASAASTIQAFRFWSDRYRSHFYTSSIAERDLIISSNPNWKFEGNAYRVLPLGSCGSAKPVYRFWSSRYRSHFYTSSVAERDVVINSNPNWKYEGESYCVFTTNVPGTTAVYRFWSDRYRSHFYTSSVAERDVVINSNQNWEYEGIAYYVYP